MSVFQMFSNENRCYNCQTIKINRLQYCNVVFEVNDGSSEKSVWKTIR